MIYGTNMPYNIPGSVRYRNALVIDPYMRVDIGFSALLLDSDKSTRRSHNPFRKFDNIWASLEIFNLLDRANTISYMFIKDFSNTVYTIPNRLTPRLLNLKILARFKSFPHLLISNYWLFQMLFIKFGQMDVLVCTIIENLKSKLIDETIINRRPLIL